MPSPYASLDQRVSSGASINPEQDPISYGAEAAVSHLDPRPSASQRGETLEEGYKKMLQREALGEASPGDANLWLESRFDDVQKYAPQLLGAGGQMPEVALSSDPTGGVLREPYTKEGWDTSGWLPKYKEMDLRSRYGVEIQPEEAPPGAPGTAIGVGASAGAAPAAATGPSYIEQLQEQTDALGSALLALGPKGEKKLRYQLDGLKKLHKDQMEFIRESTQTQKGAFDEAIGIRNDFEAKRESLADAQRHAAEGERQKLDGINNEILNFEIDPNRAFKSTWQVVGAAIAAAAGAYAQGLSQGRVPNTALAVINKAIDRDIQSQKMEIGKLQTAASIQNNIYGRMIQEHGNESRALAEARAAAIGVAQLKLNQLKSTYASGLKMQAIQVMEKQLEIEYSKSVMESQRMATTAALSGRLKEMDMLLRAGTSGTSSKLTVGQKIARVVPQFDELKKIWSKIEFQDALGYMTKYGTLWGPEGAVRGASEVKAYIQARNTTVKEIVQIFEGSKPSDLDWRVMVELLPEYWHKKAYGAEVIESFKGFLQAKGGTPLKKGELARWAIQSERMSYDQLKGTPSESIDKLKYDIGFEEPE